MIGSQQTNVHPQLALIVQMQFTNSGVSIEIISCFEMWPIPEVLVIHFVDIVEISEEISNDGLDVSGDAPVFQRRILLLLQSKGRLDLLPTSSANFK